MIPLRFGWTGWRKRDGRWRGMRARLLLRRLIRQAQQPTVYLSTCPPGFLSPLDAPPYEPDHEREQEQEKGSHNSSPGVVMSAHYVGTTHAHTACGLVSTI